MKNFIIAAFLILLLSQQEAQAYINPGSGSDFFQMLVAMILGIAKFFKNIVRKIKALFGLKNKEEKNDTANKK